MGDMFDLNDNGKIDEGEHYLVDNELNGGSGDSGDSGGSSGNSGSGGCSSYIIFFLVIALCGWLSEQGIEWPFKLLTWGIGIVVFFYIVSRKTK